MHGPKWEQGHVESHEVQERFMHIPIGLLYLHGSTMTTHQGIQMPIGKGVYLILKIGA